MGTSGYAASRPATYAATLDAINRRSGGHPVVCLQAQALAAELGRSPRTISRHLQALVRDRVITLTRLHSPSTGLWTGWRVCFRRRDQRRPTRPPNMSGPVRPQATPTVLTPPVPSTQVIRRVRRARDKTPLPRRTARQRTARQLVADLIRDVWRATPAETALRAASSPTLTLVDAELQRLAHGRFLRRWQSVIVDELTRRQDGHRRRVRAWCGRGRRGVVGFAGSVVWSSYDPRPRSQQEYQRDAERGHW